VLFEIVSDDAPHRLVCGRSCHIALPQNIHEALKKAVAVPFCRNHVVLVVL
jgi:hypothetical protein